MQKNLKNNYKKIFKGKRVLITGHTGFKGSWLSLWMHLLGAKVMGISKNIPTKPSHFISSGIDKLVKTKKIDIKDKKKLLKIISGFKPDFVFHLAAQAIVKKSYLNTTETWDSNLIGTINILESLKRLNKKKRLLLC